MAAHPLLESVLISADRALRAVFAPPQAARPTPTPPAEATALRPGATAAESTSLSEQDTRQSAALMRVNHAGEVAAQALYHGQALLARDSRTRDWLLQAAREETDHLAWCEDRLRELESRPSFLAPVWYAGSFVIGAAAAALGDRVSLGFVAETERQVEGHIDSHLQRLPEHDSRSRAILESMRQDEIAHGERARAAGGAELPEPVKWAMRNTSRVMTITSYWI